MLRRVCAIEVEFSILGESGKRGPGEPNPMIVAASPRGQTLGQVRGLQVVCYLITKFCYQL